MYRAVTLKAMRRGVPLVNVRKLALIAKTIRIRFGRQGRVYMDGQDVTKAIRTPELTQNVRFIAREGLIRRQMVKKQRLLAKKQGAVMEGRDIGTVVFPKADYKFYFRASLNIRTKRRLKDLIGVGAPLAGARRGAGTSPAPTTLARVRKDIETRDLSDRRRKQGALKVARGARVLDTTRLTIDATVDRILTILRGRGAKSP